MKRNREEKESDIKKNTNVDEDEAVEGDVSQAEAAAAENSLEEPKSKKQNSSGGVSSYLEQGLAAINIKDYGKAKELLKKGAEECVECRYRIARVYATIEKDYSKALEWFQQAAKNGHFRSFVKMANLYYEQKDYSKAIEWYQKTAEHPNPEHQSFVAKSQILVGDMYKLGMGVEKDYSKAMEWYQKAKDDPRAVAHIGKLYINGYGVGKNVKKGHLMILQGLNSPFKLIEDPYKQFAIQDYILSNENSTDVMEDDTEKEIVIRFTEREFKVSNSLLKHSKFFVAALSSNWKDLNGKENEVDMTQIQDDIFQEPDHIQVFENYVKFLTTKTIPAKMDCDMKSKLMELASFLIDDECILSVLKSSTLLMRFMILSNMELVHPLHSAITSCFATDSSLTLRGIPENLVELLLNSNRISSLAKHKIVKKFVNHFKQYPSSSIHYGKLSLQLLLTIR